MGVGAMIVLCWVVVLGQGVFYFILPRITRRGLLFGVYVGEANWAGEEAARIIRFFYEETAIGAGLGLLASLILGLVFRWEAAVLAAAFFPFFGFLVAYLRAHRRSQGLTAPQPAPPETPVLDAAAPSLGIPTLATLVCLALSILALVYAAFHYAGLPAKVPTHFDIAGVPDAWRPKSFVSVMLMPLLTLLIGTGMALSTFLIAGARSSLRAGPGATSSLLAHLGFRQVIARFVCALAVLVTLLLATGTVASIRVGLGLAARLHPAFIVLNFIVVAVAIGGTVAIALRYGQGGARLEKFAAESPLTGGLAENRYWVLGLFYVNGSDPAPIVESRFGLGYTINFGNRKAVALLATVLVLLVLVAVAAAFL
jgi:uncharacterized membrane protein